LMSFLGSSVGRAVDC